jgi:DNA-damage-inducible protein D
MGPVSPALSYSAALSGHQNHLNVQLSWQASRHHQAIVPWRTLDRPPPPCYLRAQKPAVRSTRPWVLARSHAGNIAIMTKSKAIAGRPEGRLIDRLLVAFEQAKRMDEAGQEYWLAREYAKILGYTWRRFEAVIERGKAALAHEGGVVADHFDDVVKMVPLGSGAERDIGDIELTRQACYFVGINGDPHKKDTIAAVQRYFVEQTRRQEISEMLLTGAAADADRLAVHRKHGETMREFREEVTPRVTREEHVAQIERRGQHALFRKSPDKVKEELGIPAEREATDFLKPVVVAGMSFATQLTTEQVRKNSDLKGVRKIGDVNEQNHDDVRNMMTDRSIFPEKEPIAGDIREVKDRLDKQRAKLKKGHAED